MFVPFQKPKGFWTSSHTGILMSLLSQNSNWSDLENNVIAEFQTVGFFLLAVS